MVHSVSCLSWYSLKHAKKKNIFLKQKIQMLFSYQKTKTQLSLASNAHAFSFQMHFFLSSYSDKKLCKNPYHAIESQHFLSLSESAAFMHPAIIPAHIYIICSCVFSWLNSWSASIQTFIPAGWQWCMLTSRELLNRLLGYGCHLSDFGYSF